MNGSVEESNNLSVPEKQVSNYSHQPPVISVVTAVYNVEAYIDDYLSSLDLQTSKSAVEVILVLDGSTDRSEEKIRNWSVHTEIAHRVLSKTNGGQASARNVGIRVAQGEWITFCDPDDYLAENYFEQLLSFMATDNNNVASMYATRVVGFDEASGKISASHPLNGRFRDGDRFVSLKRSPTFFHMSGATAVVRRSELERLGHLFQEKLTFSFEDAHFVSSYLLQQTNPVIGIVASSDYFYRRRAAGNSSVQISAFKPEKYSTVLVHGHLDLLARAREQHGEIPMWLQFMLLYDILWYFRGDRRVGAPSRRLDADVQREFHVLISKIMQDISEVAIHSFEIMATDNDLRNALLLGYKHTYHRPHEIYVEELDVDREMTLLHYVFSGDLPSERFIFRGVEVSPIHTKTRPMSFLGKSLFSHRYVWIPSNGTFEVSLDGVQKVLTIGKPKRERYSLRPFIVSKALAGIDVTKPKPISSPANNSSFLPLRAFRKIQRLTIRYRTKWKQTQRKKHDKQEKLLQLAVSPKIQSKYRNAWLFMDRIYRANDNAEHLYRHISKTYPRVNSWFVLDEKSPDWERLAGEGFKLLAFGSDDHKLALMNARIYASSHLDKFVTDPLEGKLAKRSKWKFVFLQHGVTDHDLSYWFNGKKIDLLVTSTKAEYASIVGDDTAYRFSTKEVALTGFPRHDALEASKVAPSIKWILVSPTWRQSLAGPSDAQGRRTKIAGFEDSDYAREWGGFLNSAELRTFAAENGLKIGLLPHPSLADYVSEMGLEQHVEILSWDDKPFAQFVHESAVLVTDYSSTAFEAAYACVPVVYFQFDQEAIKAGSHTYDVGYFDFYEDGFGPVEVDLASAISSVVELASAGMSSEYQDRTERTFKYLDSGNSDRVYNAMTRLLRPAKRNEVLSQE